MIQANELRIGNLVWDKETKKERFVDWVDFKIIRKETGCNHLIQPISLTEERLFKFGFEGNPEEGYITNKSLPFLELHHIISESDFQFEYKSPESSWKYIHIQYVNQLQNLYHALTGQELQPLPEK